MKHILIYVLAFTIVTSCGQTSSNPVYKSAIKHSKTSTWYYDASYYKISYPNGDVPSGGACTDVLIRVLRDNGIDLQKEVHQDMARNFSAYPNKWGLKKPDPNIDHRRVPNLMTYFTRKGYEVNETYVYRDFRPGDIVCWELYPGITHIGILIDAKKGSVYHNIGDKARIDDNFLWSYDIIGHYRIFPKPE